MDRELALLLALMIAACDRAPANEPAVPATTKIVVPTEAAPIVAAPPPPIEPVPIEPAPSPPVAPTVGSTTTKKPKPATKGAPTETPAPVTPPPPIKAPPPVAAPTTQTLVSEKLFRIELAPLAPCTAAATCEATLIVHALDGYKVNSEYPTKFVAKPSAGVTVNGTGTFSVAGKTPGTVPVSFRAAAAGTAKLTGALKLSVCTDEVCEIAAPVVTFDVPVT